MSGGLFEEDEQVLLRLAKRGEWTSFSAILAQIDKEHPVLRVTDKVSGWSIPFYAVADNQLEILNRLVELKCNFSHRARDSRNLCHIAAQFGNVLITEVVISQFSIEEALIPTSRGLCTPIHYACARPGSTDVARVFIRSGREHRLTPDAEGCLPIMYACEVGNVALCRELLLLYAIEQVTFANMKTGDTVLHTACRNKQFELIKLFCDQGAQLDTQNNEGHTPLHVASWEGMEETVNYLHQKGASAHIIDKMDRSPLHISAERGHTSVVEILIDKFKASVAARTKDGSTLLHIASQCGHPDTALMFLQKGVPLLMPNKTGAVCLHVAAAQGHVAVVKALCQKGANVDFKNKDGQTALHLAVRKCKPIVVQTLLGFGTNVQLFASSDMQTPLHIASKVLTNGERVAEMLIKSGADVNAQDAAGETPAHVAVRHGNMKVLDFLLGENADPTLISETGETILHVSVRFCHFQITKKLLEYTVEELTHSDAVKLVNLPNAEGETVVHLVAELDPESAHYEREELMIAKLLLEYEADLFKGSTLTSETPLHYCARGGNSSVLSAFLAYMHESANLLEDRGGSGKSKVIENNQIRSINIRNAAGWSPLMVAAEHGHPGVVEILLNNNARIDLFDEQGSTALHFACENGNVEVADELLWHHAFVGARTRKGITPLHLAAKNGHSRLCQLLIESHGAQLDILSLGKRTPLHMAAFEGRLDVCDVLLDLRADATAKDMDQQTPLHLAAENNYPEIVKLFLNYKPELASITNGNGRTCAHIAASNGSLAVLKSMVKFNREGLIEDRDSVSGSLCLHLAAAGGYGQIVKILIENGANALEENDEGLTPIHLAAQYGHLSVLEVLKVARVPLNYCSKISGLTGIHVAAFFGQAEFIQELLQNVNGQEVSAPPAGIEAAATVRFGSTSETIDYEYGFSPLHLAAECGHENVVRILLNSIGVKPECHTAIHGTTPLHLAAQQGHSSVIGLMLSKHESLLSVVDNRGRTALHMAAANGHTSLVTLLIGQGADVNHKDDSNWTPLHFAAKAGHRTVIQILIQSGASALMETSDLKQPICYAAANSHQESLRYLIRKEHNSHKLIADNRFLLDLILCGDSADDLYNMVRDFILWSPAPLEIALKLAANYKEQSAVRVDKAKDLFIASKFCQKMAVDLTSVSSTSPAAAKKIIKSEDLHGVNMLDVMIQCEQKEVVAHASIQHYLSDVWMGQYAMKTWQTLLLLVAVILPPVFVVLCLPLKWIKINRIPFVKMLLYITSHIYFVTLLTLAVAFRIQAFEGGAILLPKWSEWLIVMFFCGLVLTELLHPSDKSGLGILRIIVLLLGCIAVIIHLSALSMGDDENQYNMIYIRNQILGCVLLCCFVQLLEFLTFHHMFGPWAIIISDLMKDLFRFAVLIGIFIIGFTLEFATINQPAYPEDFCTAIGRYPLKSPETGMNNTYIEGGRVVSEQFTKMAFSIFGLVDYQAMADEAVCIPIWAEVFTYFIYGLYLVIALIVLINLLIAMMSDTYQRIQQQSDIEWKFGRALLIRSMNLKTPAAPPVNLIVVVVAFFYGLYKRKGISYVTKVLTQDDSVSLDDEDQLLNGDDEGERSAHSSVTAASVRRKLDKKDMSARKVRVENVIDWDEVMQLYREMHHVEEEGAENKRKKTDFTNYDLGGSFNTKRVIENYFDFSN